MDIARQIRTDPDEGLRRLAAEFSILISWALENGIESADSMRARGYGLPGRTQFHRETWGRREKLVLAALIVLAGATCTGFAMGSASSIFYPALSFSPPTGRNLIAWGCYALLCALPLILNRREALAWRKSRSGI